ncbi:hypothetical protein E2C01_090698 [Portunus trituberculatus]|uniref:Uncharacterized protein n=1 Tax=Portunus trituberculatus TaxID=210409 RepID=A0A5B7JT42_PORTR|nr:hypothetical protein [Portunus trituberculatus]
MCPAWNCDQRTLYHSSMTTHH